MPNSLPGIPSGTPACRGTFGGRRKAVRDRFALQGAWLTTVPMQRPSVASLHVLVLLVGQDLG